MESRELNKRLAKDSYLIAKREPKSSSSHFLSTSLHLLLMGPVNGLGFAGSETRFFF